ncbi:MAG TPA: hypothetical protein VJJ82_02845 [Candidatus Nanoarchaeia archaeon]|nr:hypothetical protein [Candidatus Nanoarchaeia archaeon]
MRYELTINPPPAAGLTCKKPVPVRVQEAKYGLALLLDADCVWTAWTVDQSSVKMPPADVPYVRAGELIFGTMPKEEAGKYLSGELLEGKVFLQRRDVEHKGEHYYIGMGTLRRIVT